MNFDLTKIYVFLEYYIKLLSDYMSKLVAYLNGTSDSSKTGA